MGWGNETYHELLFVFFFDDSSIVETNGSARVRKVESVPTLAPVTSTPETQSWYVFTLRT